MTALDGLSLIVPTGQVVGLLGSNSAWKTALSEVVCGLVRPSRGRVAVLGHDLRHRRHVIRREVGVQPPETAPTNCAVAGLRQALFYPDLVGFGGGPFGPRRERGQRYRPRDVGDGTPLEARMRRASWFLLAIGCGLALVGCGVEAPNGIVVTPEPSVTGIGPLPGVPAWSPANCPPIPETSAPKRSNLMFSGTCAFTHTGALTCQASGDDFYIAMKRTLPGGIPLDLYINVERYHGPDTYTGNAQVFMYVQDGQGLFRWYNFQATLMVGPNAASATLPRLDLLPEPGTPAVGIESVSGTIGCVKG